MRRADMYKNVNRNRHNIFHPNRIEPTNLMPSDIFVEHVWLANDDVTTGVQITELKSSESDRTVDDEKDYNDHNIRHKNDDGYKVNESARERRRLNMNHNINPTANDAQINTDPYENYPYRDVYNLPGDNAQKGHVYYNHEMNCFTILDNHLMSSETSDEDFADIELINCGDSNDAWTCDEADVLTYNPGSESEKRTVWIYSFKNKRLLSDDDFELVNIASQDVSTSSIEYQEPKEYRRLDTPIPPPHVPRLHIPTSPTLPTVTEITEGKWSSSNYTSDSIVENVKIKKNNWFLSEHVTPTEKVIKTEKSTSIVNWMALSPREKRRRFRNASPLTLPKELVSPLPTLKEVSSGVEKGCEAEEQKEDGPDDKVQSGSTHSRRSVLEQIGSAVETARKSIVTFRTSVSTLKDFSNSSESEPRDRGDHNHHTRNRKAPRIKINPNSIKKPVSDPIEKLDSEEWIHEERLVEDDRAGRGDGAVEGLWARQAALLRPAPWADYVSLADSIPSLHLSINTDSDDRRRPWYRRLAKYFNCCK